MITRYMMTIEAAADHPLHADAAYRLYAFILEQLSDEDAQWLHEEGSKAVSQYIRFDKGAGVYLWTVNILTEQTAQVLDPVLHSCQLVRIYDREFRITEKKRETVTLDQILERGKNMTGNRSRIAFQSPTAFKQGGRYTFFPQERLILQSLIMRWNLAFPNCMLQDEDAFHAMLAGIHIVDYRMRSTRFLLKGVRIPSFIGTCDLEAKLALPLLELWHTLVAFSAYAGVGIKSGLGMGGVEPIIPV